MTTTTAPATTTRDRIWSDIERAAHARPPVGFPVAGQFSDVLTGLQAVCEDLWTDLRPSEEARLQQLTHEACKTVEIRVWTEILDALSEAILVFAAEHPDAPRAGKAAAS